MAAVAALGEREVLHLRATFEPVPLLKVMAKRGFGYQVQRHSADDWSVWFHRSSGGGSACEVPARAAVERVVERSAPPAASRNEHVLDMRGLEPPEPMVLTLTALESMPADAVLVQVNERVPQFLLPVLTERGFAYEIDSGAADRVVVRIRRAE